jgi:hypothetical protein
MNYQLYHHTYHNQKQWKDIFQDLNEWTERFGWLSGNFVFVLLFFIILCSVTKKLFYILFHDCISVVDI